MLNLNPLQLLTNAISPLTAARSASGGAAGVEGTSGANRFNPNDPMSALNAGAQLWKAFSDQLGSAGLSLDRRTSDEQWQEQVGKFYDETVPKVASGEIEAGLGAQELAELVMAKKDDEETQQSIEQAKENNQSGGGCGAALGSVLGPIVDILGSVFPPLKAIGPIVSAISGGQGGTLGGLFNGAKTAADQALRQDLAA